MIAEVQQALERRADPAKKIWWENYVKGAAFRGTPMGEVRARPSCATIRRLQRAS